MEKALSMALISSISLGASERKEEEKEEKLRKEEQSELNRVFRPHKNKGKKKIKSRTSSRTKHRRAVRVVEGVVKKDIRIGRDVQQPRQHVTNVGKLVIGKRCAKRRKCAESKNRRTARTAIRLQFF